MIQIEPILLKNYSAILNKNRMPENEQYSFIKWLRYYLDFCHKYGFGKQIPATCTGLLKNFDRKSKTQVSSGGHLMLFSCFIQLALLKRLLDCFIKPRLLLKVKWSWLKKTNKII